APEEIPARSGKIPNRRARPGCYLSGDMGKAAKRRWLGTLACAVCGPVLAQGEPVVEVIATTPLPGVGVPKDSIPANVQTGTAAELRNPAVLTLPDFMERSLD